MNEFDLIDHAFCWKLPFQHPQTRLPGGDDASVHVIPDGHELVVSTDMSLAGVHWPHDFPLKNAACRAVNAALSDLAAMGAEPCWIWCCAALQNEFVAEDMGDGIAAALSGSGIELAGGDIVHASENALAVTVAGILPKGTAMQRGAARDGDDIWLCGQTGFAALGLQQWQQGMRDGEAVQAFCEVHPLLAEGKAMRQAGVRCCIDVSDGLLADAGHLATASGVGMEIELSLVPSFARLVELTDREDAAQLVLSGGEDYALVCTAPEGLRDALSSLAVRIGQCSAGGGVRVLLNGRKVRPVKRGFDHFG